MYHQSISACCLNRWVALLSESDFSSTDIFSSSSFGTTPAGASAGLSFSKEERLDFTAVVGSAAGSSGSSAFRAS